jgi:hypothetical protein
MYRYRLRKKKADMYLVFFIHIWEGLDQFFVNMLAVVTQIVHDFPEFLPNMYQALSTSSTVHRVQSCLYLILFCHCNRESIVK